MNTMTVKEKAAAFDAHEHRLDFNPAVRVFAVDGVQQDNALELIRTTAKVWAGNVDCSALECAKAVAWDLL